MTHCPKDSTVCVDDVCRGSGMCIMTNTSMLERCPICGQLADEFTYCRCEPDGDFPDDEDAPRA